jgi:hypothetical protein
MRVEVMGRARRFVASASVLRNSADSSIARARGPIFEASLAGDADSAMRAHDRLRAITSYLWTIQR